MRRLKGCLSINKNKQQAKNPPCGSSTSASSMQSLASQEKAGYMWPQNN